MAPQFQPRVLRGRLPLGRTSLRPTPSNGGFTPVTPPVLRALLYFFCKCADFFAFFSKKSVRSHDFKLFLFFNFANFTDYFVKPKKNLYDFAIFSHLEQYFCLFQPNILFSLQIFFENSKNNLYFSIISPKSIYFFLYRYRFFLALFKLICIFTEKSF